MSKDWQEQLQEEQSYEELETKLTQRTAALVDANNHIGHLQWKLYERDTLLIETNQKLREMQNAITNTVIEKTTKRKLPCKRKGTVRKQRGN
jgi:hypothetical protein